MKIKELLKYSAVPVSIAVLFLVTYLFDKNTQSAIDVFDNPLAIILFVLCMLFFLAAVILTIFVFFRNKENGFLYLSVIYLLVSLIFGNDNEFSSILLFFITIGYFVLIIRSSLRLKDNGYLKFFLILSGIVFTLNFIAFMLGVNFLMNSKLCTLITIGLFIIISFALIFSLPNSDFMEWKKEHRQFFLKTILAPWILVLYLSIRSFIISSGENISKNKQDSSPPWGMENYDIKTRDGME
jgi:hypothetical protein